MAIKKEKWEEAKVMFQMNVPLSQIAKKLGMAKSSISMKANKEEWNKQKLNEIIEQKVEYVAKLNSINTEIEQLPSNLEREVVDKEVRHRINIIDTLHNLQKGALNCHNLIVKGVLQELQNNTITGIEASRVLSLQGLDIDKIAKLAGIGNKPETAIQINNNSEQREVVINIIGE